MKTKITEVTPAMANDWLKKNSVNRSIRQNHVDYLAREIREGRWKLTHQGIAFGEDGKLRDGQHRLSAVCQANMPITVNVSWQVPNGAFTPMDRGLLRTMADITGISRKSIAIYGCLLRLGNWGYKFSPNDVHLMHNHFGLIADTLLAYCNSATVLYSSSPIQAAAVVSVLNGEPEEYVFDLYRKLVLQDLQKLPKVAYRLVRYDAHEKTRVSSKHFEGIFGRAMFVFCKDNQNTNRVASQAEIQEALKVAISFVKQAKQQENN